MPRLSKIGAAALAAFGWTGLSSVTTTYLVVAGGGGGGATRGGGGGAGGYLTGTTSLNTTLSYTVTVGAGGAGASASVGVSGANSVFNAINAIGGGGGAWQSTITGISGGSGGGGAYSSGAGGSGTSGQGFAGGTGSAANTVSAGGGGGAGAVGANGVGFVTGGAGGVGLSNSITGTATFYAGGGGGSSETVAGGAGGNGGGGAGATNGSTNAVSGTANTGGGGGGGYPNTGGNGGSGVVIISYPSPQKFGGGIVTTSGSNTIHTFQTSGTLSPLSTLSASYLIVAGGGGAGCHGGGGAGGYQTGSGVTIDTNSVYVVTVGAGGAGVASGAGGGGVNGSAGANSSFSAYATASVGGGYGGGYVSGNNGGSGGSGGGGGYSGGAPTTGGSPTSGQGYAGGTGTIGGGGGGGAGAVGVAGTGTGSQGIGGNGGTGLASSISGTSTYYAGGGGGGSGDSRTAGGSAGTGGAGGGGNGAAGIAVTGAAGTTNTGGGGGGGGSGASTNYGGGGAGGSGVVIISYAGSVQQMAGGTVTISGGNVIHTFTSSGYLTPLKLVNNSLRFRRSNSAYLSRTPTVTSNTTTWTWSGWVKRGQLTVSGSNLFLFYAGNGSSQDTGIYFTQDDLLTMEYYNAGPDYYIRTTAAYRDPAAWYHIVIAWDTTQATSSNRIKMYVNGSQVTAFNIASYPTQNLAGFINNSSYAHSVGSRNASSYFDGYMTEVNFIDGQALTPSSFGTFNSYGVWQPITYGGSYGTNGFYLPFTNKTSTTTLGYDFSPNGNNWTTNNISLTTGSTYDSMTDVPTLTSATAANYCVLNPLDKSGTITNGNLTNTTTSGYSESRGTFGISSGKWYWEQNIDQITTTNGAVCQVFGGVALASYSLTSGAGSAGMWGFQNTNSGGSNSWKFDNGTGTNTYTVFSNGDIAGFALDMGAGTLAVYRNNTLLFTCNTSLSGNTVFPFSGGYASSQTATSSANFGQQPFTYTPPTGYVALNTYNL